MIHRKLVAAVSILGCMCLCGWAHAAPSSPKVLCGAIARVNDNTRLNVIIGYLRHMLSGDKAWGRLYYQAPGCAQRNYGPVQFPGAKLTPPSKDATGIAAVRRLFLNAEGVTVTDGPDATPRITVGSVPNTILRTEVGAITLTPDEQFNPALAIGALLSSRRVLDAARLHGYRFSPMLFDYLITPPTKGLPHLPRLIRDMSLDQSLDLVAKTFKGVVVYGTSSLPHLISVDFASIAEG